MAKVTVNPDLAAERQKATFNVEDLTFHLYTEEGTKLRRETYKKVEDEPAYQISTKFPTMSREELYDKGMQVSATVVQKLADVKPEAHQLYFNNAVIYAQPFSVHYSMFIPTIKGQGTDEQIAKFLPKAESMEYIGTYAQTELGHGTFIRGLETTATFDREGQHFILNSPTLSSIKYWPGGLGRTSNYAVVMAQLIIDGKNHGLHAFMCQLRDLETHKPVPGVELGDINAKFGFDMVDNGYLKLDHVRIPRTNMLMRYAQVSPSGEYSRQSIPQTTYLTMVFVRTYIVVGVALDLAKVATIATRYSAVRRQTANKEGVEPQVLDYQTQQMKLFPAMSASYAIHFTGMALKDIYQDTMGCVESGDTVGLAELHALTSTLKAFCSDLSSEAMEVCRRSCGGHGYSHASGIASIYQKSIPAVTFEGENTVLYLQCARSLVKFLGQARKGDRLAPSLQFLSQDPQVSAKLSAAEAFDFDCYLEAVRLNVLRTLLHEVEALKVTSASVAVDEAWNRHSVGMVNAAKAFSFHLTVKYFIGAVRQRKWEPKTKDVMEHVCEFYAVNGILDSSGSYLQTGVLTGPQVKMLNSRRNKLLTLLRPNSVALVDAFDFPDRSLNSCLGRYDGNVYEALYEYAKSSALNQHQVHPAHMKYVKPLQELLKARL